MGATSVLTDSSLQCVTVAVFAFPVCMRLRMVGKSGSNVIEQETPSAKVDEMCKKLQASHSDKISFHLESCLVGSLEPVCACIRTHTHVSLFLNTLSHNALPSSFPFNFLAKSLTTFGLA